jgi:hypothetical protein
MLAVRSKNNPNSKGNKMTGAELIGKMVSCATEKDLDPSKLPDNYSPWGIVSAFNTTTDGNEYKIRWLDGNYADDTYTEDDIQEFLTNYNRDVKD